MSDIITKKQTKALQLSEQVVTNIDIEQLMSYKEYLPLSGGTVTGNVEIDGTFNINSENNFYIGDKKLAEILDELKIDKNDYTAFEVFPTDKDIPAETVDNQKGVGDLLGIENYKGILPDDHVSEYKYTDEVLSSMTHIFTLGGFSKDLTDLDIVIDWGDGTITKLADLTVNSNIDDIDNLSEETKTRLFYFIKTNPYGAYIGHTYSKSQKYTIKVYGKDYNCLRCGSGDPDGTGYANPKYNTTCRILGADLPIASNIVNMSSFSGVTNRILKIFVPYQYNFKNVNNFSGMFGRCYNLLYVDCNSSTKFNVDGILTLQSLLLYDRNLIYADLGLPSYMHNHGLTNLAADCRNLDVDIFNLLPKNNFKAGMDIYMTRSFQNCKKISCSDYDKLANLLWNNKLINFKETLHCFADCSNLNLDLIPKTWGGNGSEPTNELPEVDINLAADTLYNKTYVCFGDSFTKLSYAKYTDENGKTGEESDGYSKKYEQYKTYPVCIAERHNMALKNYAVSGSSMFMPFLGIDYNTSKELTAYTNTNTGGFVSKNNGTITKFSGGSYTDYIEITDDITYFKVAGSAYSNACIIALYDQDKAFIESIGKNAINDISQREIYNDKIIITDELKSIAASKSKTLKYIRVSTVKDGCSAIAYNATQHKSKISWTFAKKINTYENDIKTADYITIAYGLNDSGRLDGKPYDEMWINSMGKKEDETYETMFGAYNMVLKQIFTWNPSVKIGLIINDNWMHQNIHDTIIDVAKYWGIPYLDLKDDKNIPLMLGNRYDESVCKWIVDKKYDQFNDPNSSGHPNIKCHQFRSSIIEDFLKRL